MESIVANFLTRYGEKFLKNFKREDFNLNVLRGEVSLRNVELQESIIREILGVPNIIVTRAFCSSVYVKASLTRLKTEPVTVMIGTIIVNAREPKHLLDVKDKAAATGQNPLQKETPTPPASQQPQQPQKAETERAVHEQLVDAIRIEIKAVHIYIDALGSFKTDLRGQWTPRTIHIKLENILSYATDSKWQMLVDTRMLQNDQEASQASEFVCYREVSIAAFSVDFEPPEQTALGTPAASTTSTTTTTPTTPTTPQTTPQTTDPSSSTTTPPTPSTNKQNPKPKTNNDDDTTHLIQQVPMRMRIVMRKKANYDIIGLQIDLSMHEVRVCVQPWQMVPILRTLGALKQMLARPDLPEIKQDMPFPLVVSVTLDSFLVRLEDPHFKPANSTGESLHKEWTAFALRLQRIVLLMMQPGTIVQLTVDQINALALDANGLGTDRILHGAPSQLRHSLRTRNINTSNRVQLATPPMISSQPVRAPNEDSAITLQLDIQETKIKIDVHVAPLHLTLSGALVRLLDVLGSGIKDASKNEVHPPPESVYIPETLASQTPCEVSLSAPCFAFALVWQDKATNTVRVVHLNAESFSMHVDMTGSGVVMRGSVDTRMFASSHGGTLFSVLDAAHVNISADQTVTEVKAVVEIDGVPFSAQTDHLEQILQVCVFNANRLQSLITAVLGLSEAVGGVDINDIHESYTSQAIVRIGSAHVNVLSAAFPNNLLLDGKVEGIVVGSISDQYFARSLVLVDQISMQYVQGESRESLLDTTSTSAKALAQSDEQVDQTPPNVLPCVTVMHTLKLAQTPSEGLTQRVESFQSSPAVREMFRNLGDTTQNWSSMPPIEHLQRLLPALVANATRRVPENKDGSIDITSGNIDLSLSPAFILSMQGPIFILSSHLPKTYSNDLGGASASNLDLSIALNGTGVCLKQHTTQFDVKVGCCEFWMSEGRGLMQVEAGVAPDANSRLLLSSPVRATMHKNTLTNKLDVEVAPFSVCADEDVWNAVQKVLSDVSDAMPTATSRGSDTPIMAPELMPPPIQTRGSSASMSIDPGNESVGRRRQHQESFCDKQLHRLKSGMEDLDSQLVSSIRFLESAEWNFNESGVKSQQGVVEYEGWLTKMGNRVRNWKRRWFVLRSGCIYYYRKKESTLHEGIIPLGVETCVMCEGSKYGRENCFVVENPRRAYVLVAASTEDMEAWINVLLQVIARQLSSQRSVVEDDLDDTETDSVARGSVHDNGPDSDAESVPASILQPHITKPLTDREKLQMMLEDVRSSVRALNGAVRTLTTALGEERALAFLDVSSSFALDVPSDPSRRESMGGGVDEEDDSDDDQAGLAVVQTAPSSDVFATPTSRRRDEDTLEEALKFGN